MNNNENKKRDGEYLIKMSFVAIGLFVVLGIIIGSYIWNLIFDPSHFDVNKWANRAVFNGSIALACMVLGFIALVESYKSRENGKYMKRVTAFNDMVDALYKTIKIVFFDQFITWYATRQVREKKIKYLTMHGLARMDAEVIVDYASENDIERISGLRKGEEPKGEFGEDIVKEVKGKEILIPAIRDTMAAYVEEVLNGTITVNAETASYYTSIGKNSDGNLTSLERPIATEKERVKSMRRSFISKAITGLIYVTIGSLLVVDLSSGVGTAEAVWTMVLRIICATIGFIGGGFAGLTDGKFQYKEIGEKMRILIEYDQYLECGEFKPVTYEETAKERIAAVKKKEEEAKAEVLDPVPQPLQIEQNNLIPEGGK